MAYLWSNPYGFSMGEWCALTFWQKFRIFLWRLRYIRGYYCIFLQARIRSEFLHQSLKGEDFQCKCEPAQSGTLCSCSSHTRCWRDVQDRKGFCWCKCTPDGTLSQGFGDKTKYIYKEETK